MIDNILDKIKQLNEELAVEEQELDESTIDFSKGDLDPAIWQKQEDDTYLLVLEVKEMILSALKDYSDYNLVDNAQHIYIVGSIGTDLYSDDADIDVHVTPIFETLPQEATQEELEEMQREIMNYFKNNRDEKGWYVDKHPLEVYLQLNPKQDYTSDTVYDLQEDIWIKQPKFYGADYNPYEKYGHVITEIDNLTAVADAQFGKLRRDIYDYETLMSATGSDTNIEKSHEMAAEKLVSIKETIKMLSDTKSDWRAIRRRNAEVLDDVDVTNPEEVQHSDAWLSDNALVKLLDKYSYFTTIENLNALIKEDDEIQPEEIPSIKETLQKFYSL